MKFGFDSRLRLDIESVNLGWSVEVLDYEQISMALRHLKECEIIRGAGCRGERLAICRVNGQFLPFIVNTGDAIP